MCIFLLLWKSSILRLWDNMYWETMLLFLQVDELKIIFHLEWHEEMVPYWQQRLGVWICIDGNIDIYWYTSNFNYYNLNFSLIGSYCFRAFINLSWGHRSHFWWSVSHTYNIRMPEVTVLYCIDTWPNFTLNGRGTSIRLIKCKTCGFTLWFLG